MHPLGWKRKCQLTGLPSVLLCPLTVRPPSLSSQEKLHLKLEELCLQNEQASLDRCQAVLLELSEELEKKIRKGRYTVPGGHQQFLDDQRRVVEQYHLLSDKGLMVWQPAALESPPGPFPVLAQGVSWAESFVMLRGSEASELLCFLRRRSRP